MAKKINNGSIADWSVSLEGVRQLAKAIVEMQPLSELGLQYQHILDDIDAYVLPYSEESPPQPSNNPDPGGLY